MEPECYQHSSLHLVHNRSSPAVYLVVRFAHWVLEYTVDEYVFIVRIITLHTTADDDLVYLTGCGGFHQSLVETVLFVQLLFPGHQVGEHCLVSRFFLGDGPAVRPAVALVVLATAREHLDSLLVHYPCEPVAPLRLDLDALADVVEVRVDRVIHIHHHTVSWVAVEVALTHEEEVFIRLEELVIPFREVRRAHCSLEILDVLTQYILLWNMLAHAYTFGDFLSQELTLQWSFAIKFFAFNGIHNHFFDMSLQIYFAFTSCF